MRSVARDFGEWLGTVQRWVERARDQRLDRVDWSDRPRIARNLRRTSAEIEDLVLSVRQELRESDLGEFGAKAIHRDLLLREISERPSVRTIGRVLERRGALDGRRRIRRLAPPRGWYLPEVARGQLELDSFDIVEGLVIQSGPQVEVLNVISLHGGLAASWPQTAVSAKAASETALQHWREFGLPGYAQFDNDTVFQGAHQHRDVISRVMRVCLALGVVPVFTPPRESGFQAAIEAFNGRWQVKVWARFRHDSLNALQERSDRYIQALRARAAERIEAAPARRPFPVDWCQDLQAHPRGMLIFIRRTTDRGTVYLLGRSFDVDSLWLHRLVRCEVDLDAGEVRFVALRRRQPDHQPLLRKSAYELPRRRFQE